MLWDEFCFKPEVLNLGVEVIKILDVVWSLAYCEMFGAVISYLVDGDDNNYHWDTFFMTFGKAIYGRCAISQIQSILRGTVDKSLLL